MGIINFTPLVVTTTEVVIEPEPQSDDGETIVRGED